MFALILLKHKRRCEFQSSVLSLVDSANNLAFSLTVIRDVFSDPTLLSFTHFYFPFHTPTSSFSLRLIFTFESTDHLKEYI